MRVIQGSKTVASKQPSKKAGKKKVLGKKEVEADAADETPNSNAAMPKGDTPSFNVPGHIETPMIAMTVKERRKLLR